MEQPRHVEVQIFADIHGNLVHLFERDCSVQRRHQKIVEIAPALRIPQATREALWADALKFCRAAEYVNAGTVEFLVDEQGRHHFIEVFKYKLKTTSVILRYCCRSTTHCQLRKYVCRTSVRLIHAFKSSTR